MELFFQISSIFGWLGAALFLVIYHRSSRWWEVSYGRALFGMATVSFMFFSMSVVFNLFGPDYSGRTALRVTNMVINISVIWYLLFTLVRGVTRARRRRPDES